jgi:hypothetical protein
LDRCRGTIASDGVDAIDRPSLTTFETLYVLCSQKTGTKVTVIQKPFRALLQPGSDHNALTPRREQQCNKEADATKGYRKRAGILIVAYEEDGDEDRYCWINRQAQDPSGMSTLVVTIVRD